MTYVCHLDTDVICVSISYPSVTRFHHAYIRHNQALGHTTLILWYVEQITVSCTLRCKCFIGCCRSQYISTTQEIKHLCSSKDWLQDELTESILSGMVSLR